MNRLTLFCFFLYFPVVGFSQDISLKAMSEYLRNDYDYFETEVSKKGYIFHKVTNGKVDKDTNLKIYHFFKTYNGEEEYISYEKMTISWRPDFKEIGISYSTSNLANFNSIKSDLKLNHYKLVKTQEADSGYTIINSYDNAEFSYLIETRLENNRELKLIRYNVSVSSKPWFRVMEIPK